MPMSESRAFHGSAVIVVFVLWVTQIAVCVRAVEIRIDYSYDTNDFFGSGNPQGAAGGAEARLALETAASYFSDILSDEMLGIEIPATFTSQVFNGSISWYWEAGFFHPSSGEYVTPRNITVLPNEYIIYVGSQDLSEEVLAVGGPGDASWDFEIAVDEFTEEEIDELVQISVDFYDTVANRGQPESEFSSWGGAISFSARSDVNWHYNLDTFPELDASDFYSTAIHEIAHAVGFGSSPEWEQLVEGTNFTGPSTVEYYGEPVPLDADLSHWPEDTYEFIFGTSILQKTSLDPSLTDGDSILLTTLDALALEDIGWELLVPYYNQADFTLDGYVDGTDLTIWELYFGFFGNGDADSDGDADGNDLLLWQRNYSGAELASQSVGSVPETSTSIMLLGLTGWLAANRRSYMRSVMHPCRRQS